MTDPAGAVHHVPLAGPSAVVGRAAGSAVHLDHGMVSRQHARLERLADGAWQVTDLRSHNGTLVDGTAVTTAVLRPGARVQVGPFTLRVDPPPSASAPLGATMMAPPPAAVTRLAMGDDGRMIRTLKEVQPPRLAVDQLRCLDDFGRAVLGEADADARMSALCRLMLDPCFGGRWAVTVTLPAGSDGAEPLCPVQQADESRGGEARLSRSLLRAARTRGEPVIATNRPGGAAAESEIELSMAVGGTTMAAVAVPLDPAKGAAAGLLYATFPPEYGTGEWLALCALAVRHHRQAETVWANIAAGRKLAAFEADLERARRVQDRLVPRAATLAGLDVATRFRPCLAWPGTTSTRCSCRTGGRCWWWPTCRARGCRRRWWRWGCTRWSTSPPGGGPGWATWPPPSTPTWSSRSRRRRSSR